MEPRAAPTERTDRRCAPLLRFGGHDWSTLGVLQAGSISVASVLVVIDARRRRPRAPGASPTAPA